MTARGTTSHPVIGLTLGSSGIEGRRSHVLDAAYTDAVLRAGGIPILLPAACPSRMRQTLEHLDGLVLTGGGDMHPCRYGATQQAELDRVDHSRDDCEIALAVHARELGLPMLAICRGLQVLNVASGGTLQQHVDNAEAHGAVTREPVLHEVLVSTGSQLGTTVGAGAVQVACRHHQAVDLLGVGLHTVALAADGVIEAIEDSDGLVTAVQWHPERTAETDPRQQALFAALVTRARTRRHSDPAGLCP